MVATRKQTPQQARKASVESSLTPLYAVAGLTDVLAEEARTRLTETQQRAQQRLTELRQRPGDLQAQVKQNADDLARFVAELPAHLRALPATTRERAQQLSEQATERLSGAGTAYADLAGRGKRRVDETISTAQNFGGRARKRTEDALKDADPVFEGVQETVTRVRKAATGRTATETVTPKKAPATKVPAKKTAAKKTTAKKATTPKASTTKASPKKVPAKKTASKS